MALSSISRNVQWWASRKRIWEEDEMKFKKGMAIAYRRSIYLFFELCTEMAKTNAKLADSTAAHVNKDKKNKKDNENIFPKDSKKMLSSDG